MKQTCCNKHLCGASRDCSALQLGHIAGAGSVVVGTARPAMPRGDEAPSATVHGTAPEAERCCDAVYVWTGQESRVGQESGADGHDDRYQDVCSVLLHGCEYFNAHMQVADQDSEANAHMQVADQDSEAKAKGSKNELDQAASASASPTMHEFEPAPKRRRASVTALAHSTPRSSSPATPPSPTSGRRTSASLACARHVAPSFGASGDADSGTASRCSTEPSSPPTNYKSQLPDRKCVELHQLLRKLPSP